MKRNRTNHLIRAVNDSGFDRFDQGGRELGAAACLVGVVRIADGTATVIFAIEEYGTGASRDWAAKGTQLLSVKAVIAKSFERIHRSNLVGMGVLPLQFKGSDSLGSLNLTGDETFDQIGINDNLKPQQDVTLTITRKDGSKQNVALLLRIDTPIEVD